jgi:ABC-type sugar transport system ATPase subunit
MTSPTISIGGLTRRYRGQLALDDVTFDVQGASITGLLGRNGAGKTTLLRIIAGHEFASAGHVTVLGADPVKDEAVLRRMMFIREDQTYPDLKVRHALRVASLIGLLTLGAAQIILLVGGAAVATATHAWPAVGHFFTTLSVTGLTGLLAALAAVLLAGGFTTVHRITV